MSIIPDHFKLNLQPMAQAEAMVQHGNARFTVLRDRLIRLEYHPENCFEDRASQAFWYRQQPVPKFAVNQSGDTLTIETDYLLLEYTADESNGFTANNLSITQKENGIKWHKDLPTADNLGGTTRTLDFVNGYAPLQDGPISRAGWSVLDDSTSLVLNNEGWLEPRVAGGTDWYFFGYGHAYKACLQDYCKISGSMPLIPRWVLGNWWSRYWHYTQAEFTQLINDFENRLIAFVRDGTRRRVSAHMNRLFEPAPFVRTDLREIDD